MKSVALLLLASLLALPLGAKIVTRSVAYEHGGTKLQGYLAFDDAKSGKAPGVLVCQSGGV